MEDITGNSFRSICFKYGADITFTEMIRVRGFAEKNINTWSKLDFKDETPVIIQLIGGKELNFKRFLNMFEPPKSFQGFNLNIGCPNPEFIRLGQGCAMIRRISKTKKILKIINDYGFKSSIKMRLGMNQLEKEKKVYLNILNSIDAEFFVIHARHGQQTYKEPAEFSIYDACAKSKKTIIANGDITTKEQVDHLRSIGVDGVMIGRAAVLDPSIFNRLKGIPSPPVEKIFKEYISISNKFNEPFKYIKNVLKHRDNNSTKPLESAFQQ